MTHKSLAVATAQAAFVAQPSQAMSVSKVRVEVQVNCVISHVLSPLTKTSDKQDESCLPSQSWTPASSVSQLENPFREVTAKKTEAVSNVRMPDLPVWTLLNLLNQHARTSSSSSMSRNTSSCDPMKRLLSLLLFCTYQKLAG